MSIQVEPDSQGNITITIKLMITGAGPGAVDIGTVILPVVNQEDNASSPSENLLQSDSDDSTVRDEDNNKGETDDDAGAKQVKSAPYSLRTRIRVEDDTNESNSDGDYEVDYELSQQVTAFRM